MSAPKHVVGLSGGKDSTALALWLAENEPREYEFICNETGNELPAMYTHWRNLERPARTDCALCPYQRLGEWRDLWANHPDKWAEGVAIEKRHGHTFRSAGRDTWPADLESLGLEFASGRPLRNSKRDTTCRVCSL